MEDCLFQRLIRWYLQPVFKGISIKHLVYESAAQQRHAADRYRGRWCLALGGLCSLAQVQRNGLHNPVLDDQAFRLQDNKANVGVAGAFRLCEIQGASS